MSAPSPVALITGASSGIGRATALALARRGYAVAVTARRAERLAALAETCEADGASALVLAGDLSDAGFAATLPARAAEHFGRLDVVVNNAAMPLHKNIYETTVDEVVRALDVNFVAMVACVLHAIPVLLRQGGGTLVNISSVAAKVVPTHEAGYAASKAAMNAFSEGLMTDLHGSGIHVGLVHPGPIETEIWDKIEQPGAYAGKRYPAEWVADAVLEVVERRRTEIFVPRRHAGLIAARWLRALAPSLLRRGVRANDPVTPEMLAAARARAGVEQSDA